MRKIMPSYALCEIEDRVTEHVNRAFGIEREHQARKFRSARLDMALTHQDCAKLLRVSVRTVQNWEAARGRIPHAAYKLMRVLRGGKYLGAQWRDFFVRGDVLVTPEGHEFAAGDLSWWSLLIRQATAFREIMDKQRKAAAAALAASAASATAVAAADMLSTEGPRSLAWSLEHGIQSRPSMPRATRPAAGKDPKCPPEKGQALPRDVVSKQQGSRITDNAVRRMERAKSLISKGKSSDSLKGSVPDNLPLSLTQQLRPEPVSSKTSLDIPSRPLRSRGQALRK